MNSNFSYSSSFYLQLLDVCPASKIQHPKSDARNPVEIPHFGVSDSGCKPSLDYDGYCDTDINHVIIRECVTSYFLFLSLRFHDKFSVFEAVVITN